jgi:hypothetical protein
MMSKTITKNAVIRQLDDGLILRRSTQADAQALADFNSKLHSDDGPEKPDERVGTWASDLLIGNHPTFGEGDFTIVEETASGKIVSSLNLISQTWSYAGIPFKVGRPEMVGTLPEYRNRGLIRAQFDVVHQWSAERGEMVQGITGIPYYYRLFGYEMALNLDGGRAGFKAQLPKLKEDKEEDYLFRTVLKKDIPFITRTFRNGSQRNLVRCEWDKDLFQYEIFGKSPQNINRLEFRIIEDKHGNPVGFIAHPAWTWGAMLPALLYELKEGISWGEVTPSVARYLFTTGEAYAAEKENKDFDAFGFWLGEQHPVYDVFGDRLPRVRKPYAWYIRVPDLPAFLRLISPVLEERLAGSAYAGHSGEYKLTFYRQGIRFVLEKGALTTIEAYHPEPQGHSGDAAFPELTFLKLLFGYRTLDEIKYAFPDCWTHDDEITGLLKSMFPKHNSSVWAVS